MANKWASKDYVFQPGELPLYPKKLPPGFIPQWSLVNDDNIASITSLVESAERVSFDTETTSLYLDELLLVSFSFSVKDYNFVCIVNHSDDSVCTHDADAVLTLVHAILSRPVCFLFNARFDLSVVDKCLLLPFSQYRPVDVQSLVFIADTNVKMPSLKWCEQYFLGIEAPSFAAMKGEVINLQYVDPYRLGEYSAYDSFGTLALGNMFYDLIMSRYKFVAELDRKLIPALMYFERSEFNISKEELLSISDQAKEKALEMQLKIYEAVGPFLLTSPKQLGAKLVELGYDTGERTKTGQMAVSIKVLENHRNVEFISWYIDYKKLVKLTSAYVQPLLRRAELGHPYRFHYILNNAPTMRLAAGAYSKPKKKALQQTHFFTDMNFQSISKPKMTERRIDWDPNTLEVTFSETGKYLVEAGSPSLNLRKAFIPGDPDFVACAIDFAGQELRIAANMSGEPVWINAFNSGADIHAETAKTIWGAANYDKNKRKSAKTANFGVLYGGSTFFLMQGLHLSEPEALKFIKDYKAALPQLFRWIDSVHATARRQGYVISPYGLPRRLSYYYRMGGGSASFADRSSVNTLVQGSAGIIIRIALTRLYSLIGPGGKFHGDVLFRGTVHDELDFIVRRSVFREFLKDVIPLMTNTVPKSWPVPMEVEVSVGPNWGELVAIDHSHPDLLPKVVDAKPTEVREDGDEEWLSYDEDLDDEDFEDEDL
jgi:DNA polymerase-1